MRPRDVTTPAGTIRLAGRANDLELMLMGAKPPADCYPDSGGDFHWIEPTLMVGPPMGYFAGIYVQFDANDTLYFGFSGDHRRLVVGRPGMHSPSPVEIPGYRPLRSEFEAMMLRIVRRGSRWLCQARRGNTASSILAGALGGGGPMMFDGLASAQKAPTTGDFEEFRTVAVVDIPKTPRTIGSMVKTWTTILVESQVFTFEVQDGEAPTFFAASSAVEANTESSPPPAGVLVREVPREGAWIRRRNSSLKLGVPHVGDPYDHWVGVDKVPKLFMRAPTGDFAFGSSCKVSRAFVSPDAGGGALGCEVWGRQHSASVRDVVVPDRLRRAWVRPPATFRTAFIIVAPRRSDVPPELLGHVELLRNAFDATFRDYTSGLLMSDSRM